MTKYDNTREVVFKEDYAPTTERQKQKGIKGKVIYKKGSKHYIHKNVVEKITARGAKIEGKEIDPSWVKKVEEKAKETLRKNKAKV